MTLEVCKISGVKMRLLGKACAIGGAAIVVFGLPACASHGDVASSSVIGRSDMASPLAEFLGNSVWSRQEEFERAGQEFLVRREELVAQCMLEAGFQYLPDLTNPLAGAPVASAFDEVHEDDRDWVELYGFGMVSGHRTVSGWTIYDVRDDPNQEYLDSLAESERAAFELALHGSAYATTPNEDWIQSDFDNVFANMGCFGQAQIQAQNESSLFLRNQDEFAPLFRALDEMYGEVARNPEMITLNQEWLGCMMTAGHRTPDSTKGEMSARVFIIRSRQNAGIATLEDEAELADIQKQEIELALASLDCREAVDFRNREAAIMHDAETQFVYDHRAALEAYRDAEAQRDAG